MFLSHLDLTSVIVYSFLIITFIVGVLSSKRIKDIKEYALANKMFGTGVLTMSMTATYLGANVIYTQKNILKYGIVAGLAFIGTVINFALTSKFIIPKLAKFSNCFTLGDVIKEIYGNTAELIVSFLGVIFSILRAGSGLVALGHVCNLFLGWDTTFSIISIGLMLVLYSAKGGIKSITITDVMHFTVFIFVIPLIANIAVNKAGGFMNIFASLPKEKLNITSSSQVAKYLSNFLMWSIFGPLLTQPAVIQRVLMAEYNKHAQIMMFNTGALTLFIRALVTITCLAILIIEPNINPTSAGGFLYVINNFLSPSLRIVCVLGMLSLLISTIDSLLNAGAVLLTHNFVTPIFSKQGIKINQVNMARYASVAIGVLCIFISLYNTEEIRTLSSVSTSTFSFITIPFILGIFGLRSSSSVFVLTTVVNTFVFAYLSIYVIDYSKDFIQQPILAATSLITFCLIHLVTHGKFSFKKENLSEVIESSNLEEVNKSGINYVKFAITLSIIYALPFFIPYQDILNKVVVLRLIAIIMCIGLLLKPYWFNSWNKYFPMYWKITVLYCVPFMAAVFYILNGSRIEWALAIALATLLLISLLNWKEFIITSLLGFSLGAFVTHNLLNIPFSNDFGNYIILFLAVLFAIAVGFLFVRPRELKNELIRLKLEMNNNNTEQRLVRVLDTPNRLRNILGDEGLYITSGIPKFKEEIRSLLRSGDRELVKKAEEKIFSILSYFLEVNEQLENHITLRIDSVSLLKLINDSMEHADLPSEATIDPYIGTVFDSLECDPNKIIRVLGSSINMVWENEKELPISVFIEDTMLGYTISSVPNDYVKKIDAIRFTITSEHSPLPLNECFMGNISDAVQIRTHNPELLPKLENEQIIKAHYGVYNFSNTLIEVIIPCNVSEIRPKKLDREDMEKFISDPDIEHVFSKLAEEKFINSISERAPDVDIEKVKEALMFCKKYHQNQVRKSGEPFYLHPLMVSQILLDYTQDEDAIIAALLHDTVEDTKATLGLISTIFGHKVGDIVEGVTKLGKDNISLNTKESFIKLAKDTNKFSLYIKIADRIHNLRTIKGHNSEEKRKFIAKETLELFAPLAADLNLYSAVQEITGRCLSILYGTKSVRQFEM